jgi:hypothetical protein
MEIQERIGLVLMVATFGLAVILSLEPSLIGSAWNALRSAFRRRND